MTRKSSRTSRLTAGDRLKRAKRFYGSSRFPAAAREARGAWEAFTREGRTSEATTAALLSLFSFAKAGEFERGWQLAMEASGHAAHELDFCYAACYLAYQRGDYDETERWGKAFLQLHGDPFTHSTERNTQDKLHEILNTLGCAAKDRGLDAAAMEYFERARRQAPDYPLPYLNLALLHKRAGALDLAERIVAEGMSRCPSEELRLFKKGLLTDRTISLCMIVKDEEKMLGEALASVRGVVDEIIVVDTGSTDSTVEIARKAGARVFHHPWENDFSKARNQSLSYATCDWVLILDADERLEASSAPLVRKLAQSCLQEALSFSVYNVDLDSGHVSFLPSMRMFRNRRGYEYRGIVHNQIDLPRDTPVMRAPVRIDHYGYTPSVAEARGKYGRTTSLLRRQLEENPDDAFAHFNMAQIMRGGEEARTRAQEIAFHARRVIELIRPGESDHRHILLMAYHQLATALFHLEDWAGSEKACRDALALKPDFIDPLITLGHVLSQRKRWVEARDAFLEYLRVCAEYDESIETRGFILLHLESEHQAHYGLGIVEEALGQFPMALEWYRRTLEARPRYLDTHVRIGRLCYALGRFDEARTAFVTELAAEPDSFWSHYSMGDIEAKSGRFSEALAHYQYALQLEPHHETLHVNIAACAHRLGNPGLAREHLKQVDPRLLEEPAALRLAGDISFGAGDMESARTSYEKLLASHPDDGSLWSDLGNVHFRLSEWQKALACYDRALTESPDFWLARRNRALVFLKRGQSTEATAELDLYLKNSEADADVLCLLADLHAHGGRFEQALGYYEKYLALRPTDHDALFRLSQSYHAMGQQDAALLGYRHLLSLDPGYEPAHKALQSLQTA